MKVLAIDSSSSIASAALLDGNILVAEYTVNNKKTHSQILMPMIEELLKKTSIKIDEIDAFAVCAGPGSFTGLRIGIATAKGLAHACNKPLVCVSTLEAMAYNLPYCSHLIVPLLDARRDQVYGAVYRYNNDNVDTLIAPCAVSIDEILDNITKTKQKAVFIGDGALRFGEYIKEKIGDNAIFLYANSNMQRASSVGTIAQIKLINGESVTYDKAFPVYLRKSQAEREYENNN